MLTDVVLEKVPGYIVNQDDKSVSAATIKPFNGGFTWQNDIAVDIFENDYTLANNYTVLHGNASRDNILQPEGDWRDERYEVEYYVNEKYSSLAFEIAPYADFGTSATS